MRTDYTRQTRWGRRPGPAPGEVPPGAIYVRTMTWTPCNTCDLQVHVPLAEAVREGVTCPECGAQLLAPTARADAAAARLEATERGFRAGVEPGTPFTGGE
jgi:predicted RNA-binding Zn-ribbon protein involved in translation (DUF1610 family)